MIINIVVFFLLGLGAFTFGLLPLKRWGYLWFALAYIGVCVGVFIGVTNVMGTPRPAWTMLLPDHSRAQVIGASIAEGEAIYVFLMPDGASKPVLLEFPWSVQTAQQLQNAMRESEASGVGIVMEIILSNSGLDTNEPKFYATPQPPAPDKNYNTGTAEEVTR